MSYDEILRHEDCPFVVDGNRHTVGKRGLSTPGGTVVSYVLLKENGSMWQEMPGCDWERTELIRRADSDGWDIDGYKSWSDEDYDDFVVPYLKDYTSRVYGDEINDIHS